MDFLPGGALSGLQSRLIFIFMITASLVIALTAAAQDQFNSKVALLIACQDYQENLGEIGLKPLGSPRNDMAYLAKELEHLGYEVRRIEGKINDVLDKDQILKEVKTFSDNLQSIDDVFVCLSGHGIQLYSERFDSLYDGLYFVPEKASPEDIAPCDDPGPESYFDNSLVSIAEIVDLLKREVKDLILVLDCCRVDAGKAVKAVKPAKTKPRKKLELKINIVYATPLGQAAFESKSQLGILEFEDLTDSGKHSNFTFQLIKYLRGECRPEYYVTLESDLKKLDLDNALNAIELDSKQRPSYFGPNRNLTFGTLTAYPWDIQQYTARLEKSKTIRIGTSQALEFLLIDPPDVKGKKIQLVDKFLSKQPKLIDATIKMPYYLGVTEVSRQNWIDCLSDPISADFLREIQAPKDLQEDLLKRFKTAAGSTDLPASCTWPEAVLYCQLMTKRLHPQQLGFYKIDGLEVSKNKQERSVTGIELQYNPKAYGFRLPAEVQWHWAVFQNGNPIEVIKKSPSGVLKALRNGVKPPLGPVGLADPNEQNTFGFRYALGNMAEWIWDDWSRTESIRVLTAAENPTKIGKEKKLGEKLLKGAGILDKIEDQRRRSKPGSLDEDTGLRLLYQPPPVQ